MISLATLPIPARLKPVLRRLWNLSLKLQWRLQSLPAILEARIIRNIRCTINDARARHLLSALEQKIEHASHQPGLMSVEESNELSRSLREWVKYSAGLRTGNDGKETLAELLSEIDHLRKKNHQIKPLFSRLASKRILYAGQAYYNAWYLSRALRGHAWKANVLNWDMNEASQIYYHGEDIRFTPEIPYPLVRDVRFYVAAIYDYDIFHFSNTHGMCFGFSLQSFFEGKWGKYSEIYLLKTLGKKIAYSNNGCQDGAAQSSFAKWGPESVCAICPWQKRPEICCDERNLAWGKFRNDVADYQCQLGGNRVDYNAAPTVHESPQFYCLEPEVWNPELPIPERLKLPAVTPGTVRLYHAVGHKKERTSAEGINIKSSHLYFPLIEKLQAEGMSLELIAPTGIPNKDVRFLQMQADIFLEMLTYGWFGANAREAMMLGKPVICYIRPEWLASVRQEIPEYADTLPIISATPHTVEAVLRDLIANPEKRREIGERSRAFALKWHSSDIAGQHFDEIYTKLLSGDPLRLAQYE